MTVDLEQHLGALLDRHPDLRDTLGPAWHEATRVMSPAGLQAYADGAQALGNLGRGLDPLRAYLEEMPQVVRECGEDVIDDCVSAALQLSSMTSGAVIALLFASLPTAARRLGDPELLRGYLTLIHQMSARAARGLRPMLQNIDELLSKLTLSGLRRWADFGIEAYRRDHDNLVRYFGLKSQDAQAMLQQQRRGTLFVDSQRRLNFYLRALWGRDFFLRPTGADDDGFRPYVERNVVHVPDAVDGVGAGEAAVSGFDLYKAMTAHMAAHLTGMTAAMPADDMAPAEKFLVGLLEDARVEYRAVTAFPGLRDLWRRLLSLPHDPAAVEHPTVVLLERLALALLDPDVRADDADLDAIAAAFHAGVTENRDDPLFARDLGRDLFARLTARKAMPSLRVLESIRLPHRDDNRILWSFEPVLAEDALDYVPASQRQVRRTVSVMEMVNEIDCELAGDDAQEIWRLETPFWLDQEACTINELEGKEPISVPFHYHEWDHQVQLYRPDWATVYERRQPRGLASDIDGILEAHRPITHTIRRIIDTLQPQGVQRLRNLEDGDEIDINAAVDAMVDIRAGRQPDPRITLRNVINRRDLAVVLLLDLSESTNDLLPEVEERAANDDEAEETPEGIVPGKPRTVLDLTREATALVATAIQGIGDPFAIHGFSSDSRHDVQYVRFKDFNQGFDDPAKARLAGMRGGLSTRMGAAMRHAAAHLLKRPERRKLLLLVTDGAPADVDERDPQHLRQDTRKAVEELHTQGILTYCLTLDPHADAYVKRIFGEHRYTVVDHVRRLPEKLPTLFASLTG
jgi:hypothetical protein